MSYLYWDIFSSTFWHVFWGLIFVAWLGAMIGLIVYLISRHVNGDNGNNSVQPVMRTVRVLGKTRQGNCEWYLVEFENGSRKQFKNLNPGRIFMMPGDVGIMTFRGMNIQSFQANRQYQRSQYSAQNYRNY